MIEQVLQSTEPVGEPFECNVNFIVFLDTYADGWFVEYALEKDDPTDMVWKRWHNQPLQEHGELSYVIVCGVKQFRFRMNSGTTGATAYRIPFRGMD